MNIVVTGGFGNVGRNTVEACLAAGHDVVVFETASALKRAGAGLRKLLNTRWAACKIVFGDIRSAADIGRAFSAFENGPDAVIHLAAIIPPAADRNPERARDINIGGTTRIIEVCKAQPRPPRLVFASSIAIYGDRVADFWIKTGDELHPNDPYAETKLASETALRGSGLDFVILRLSYVAWAKWLPFDPLLFLMPLETRLEIIHTEDAGRAFAAAASLPEASGQTLNIGGGALCRTFFKAYLDRILRYYGLGDSSFLSPSLFASSDFHCGWYEDSDYAESLLHFRHKTLEDYYEEVRWETRFLRPFVSIVAPVAKRWLAAKSPFAAKASKRRAGEHPKPLRLSEQEKR